MPGRGDGLGIRLIAITGGMGVEGVSRDQKRARWFGVLYLITFVTSIPAALLYRPVLDDPVAYIAGAGHDKRILFGAFLELLLIVANIGTAVVIVPIIWRRYQELSAWHHLRQRAAWSRRAPQRS